MRPRGEVRQALLQAAHEVGCAGATWRELAHRSAVGQDAARRTVDNMARAGELLVIGQQSQAGSTGRWSNVYAPAPEQPAPDRDAVQALYAVCKRWADFR